MDKNDQKINKKVDCGQSSAVAQKTNSDLEKIGEAEQTAFSLKHQAAQKVAGQANYSGY
jgi:hypothetical protein